MAPGTSAKAPRAKLDLSPDKVKGKGAESNRKAPQTPKESHRKKPALKKKAGSSKDLVGETSAEGAEEAAPEGRPSSPVPEPEQLPVAEEQSEVAELKALLGGRTDPAKEPVEATAPSPAVADALRQQQWRRPLRHRQHQQRGVEEAQPGEESPGADRQTPRFRGLNRGDGPARRAQRGAGQADGGRRDGGFHRGRSAEPSKGQTAAPATF